MTRPTVSALVAAIVIACLISALSAAQGLGIRPVDADSAREAASTVIDASSESPFAVAMKTAKTQAERDMLMDIYRRCPFAVAVSSPFDRVRRLTIGARLLIVDSPMPSLDEINAKGVQVHVGPKDFNGASIDSVVIKRGPTSLRPLHVERSHEVVSNNLGNSRTVRTADFFFPLPAFEPSVPITIVLAGAASTCEWPLSRAALETLR